MHLRDYNYVFCSLNVEEDLLHLLFHCPFAMACWYNLNIIIQNYDDLPTILEGIKTQLRVSFFIEVIVTMCWAIWMMRNDIIIRNLANCKHVS